MTPEQLLRLTESDTSLQILDPLPEMQFKREHLKGAVNVCVYEVAFDEKAQKTLDKNVKTVAYGLNDRFEASHLAVDRLKALGFTDVDRLEGGLEAWREAGFDTEQTAEPKPQPHGLFPINVSESKIRWVGRNLFNQHNGTVPIESGVVAFENGALKNGEIAIDLTRIHCSDIEDPEQNKGLLNHLATEDFFLTDKHPTARCSINSVTAIPGVTPGRPNVTLAGDFTLRGETRPIASTALVGWSDDTISIQGQCALDRTHHHSKYGSGRFFEALGMYLVNDLVSISFQLKAGL